MVMRIKSTLIISLIIVSIILFVASIHAIEQQDGIAHDSDQLESDSELWGWPRGMCATGNFCPLPQSAEEGHEEQEELHRFVRDWIEDIVDIRFNRGFALSEHRTVKSRGGRRRHTRSQLRKSLFVDRIRKLVETLQRAGDADEVESLSQDFGRGFVHNGRGSNRGYALYDDDNDDELESLSQDIGRGFVHNGQQGGGGGTAYALQDTDGHHLHHLRSYPQHSFRNQHIERG